MGTSPGGLLGTSPGGSGWSSGPSYPSLSRSSLPLDRNSVSFGPYGASPPTPTRSEGAAGVPNFARKSVQAHSLCVRSERVLAWVARKGRHCHTLIMDFRCAAQYVHS